MDVGLCDSQTAAVQIRVFEPTDSVEEGPRLDKSVEEELARAASRALGISSKKKPRKPR
ncbi:hypothetical protein IWW55_003600, partial [Coemansia sp. RSA 2706]